MKYINTTMLICLLALVSCNHDKTHDHSSAEETTEHEIHNPSEESSMDEIVLSPASAEKYGVKTEILTKKPFSDVLKVSGSIIGAPDDVTSIVAKSSGVLSFNKDIVPGRKLQAGTAIGTVNSKGLSGGDADEVASLQYQAAKKELDRITPLYKDGIVSAKEYNAAVAACEQARAAYSGRNSGSSLVSPVNGVITELLVKQGEYVTVGQQVATVSRNSRLMLRADVPQKYHSIISGITSANFRPAYSEEVFSITELNGSRSSSTDNVSLQLGYIPVYFAFDNNGSVVPGSSAEVYLQREAVDSMLVIPVSALTEQQGKLFAYVKLDDHGYEKRNVTIGMSNGKNAQLLSGINEGETIVTEGVIFVKLAETSNVVPEGHSHNH